MDLLALLLVVRGWLTLGVVYVHLIRQIIPSFVPLVAALLFFQGVLMFVDRMNRITCRLHLGQKVLVLLHLRILVHLVMRSALATDQHVYCKVGWLTLPVT